MNNLENNELANNMNEGDKQLYGEEALATNPNSQTIETEKKQPPYPQQRGGQQQPMPNQQAVRQQRPMPNQQAVRQQRPMPNQQAVRQQRPMPNQQAVRQQQPIPNQQAVRQQQQIPNQTMVQQPQSQGYSDYAPLIMFSETTFKMMANVSLLFICLGAIISIIKLLPWTTLSTIITAAKGAPFLGASQSADFAKMEFFSGSLTLLIITLITIVIFSLNRLFKFTKREAEYSTMALFLESGISFLVFLFMIICVAIASSKTKGIINFSVLEWICVIFALVSSISLAALVFLNQQNKTYVNRLTINQLVPLLIVIGFDLIVLFVFLISFLMI